MSVMIINISKLIPLIAVGVLTACQLPAEILYSGDRNIAFGNSYGIPDPFQFATAPNTFKIDFNSDGAPDIAIFRSLFTYPFVAIGGLNGAQFSTAIGSPARPRLGGEIIDSTSVWAGNSVFGELNFAASFTPNSKRGGLFYNERGYIAASFPLVDGLHYGWVDYESDETGRSGTVFGWAWEKMPDTAIIAGDRGPGAVPEPSTYALGSVAALGVLIARRRRR